MMLRPRLTAPSGTRRKVRARSAGGADGAGYRAEPRVVGLEGRAVGELLALGRTWPLRSGRKGLEDICAAEQQKRMLLGLCRRSGQDLGDGLYRQRDPALRS